MLMIKTLLDIVSNVIYFRLESQIISLYAMLFEYQCFSECLDAPILLLSLSDPQYYISVLFIYFKNYSTTW